MGKMLEDKITLDNYSIKQNSTLFLVVQSKAPSSLKDDEYGIKLMSGDTVLELKELHINTSIAAGTSETTLDLVFFNSHSISEAELDLPIPENAVICGYSYEYEGKMIPASIVEKEKARITFEKEVRSGGAVSLVEHVAGNNFKVRIYPLSYNATKRVSITFISELEFTSPGNFQYYLPFLVSSKLTSLTMNMNVHSINGSVRSGYAGLDFSKSTVYPNVYTAKLDSNNVNLPTPVVVDVEIPVMNCNSVYISQKGEEDYFVANIVPDFPVAASESTSKGKLLAFWDASFSLLKDDKSAAIETLVEVTSKAKDGVDLVVFRNDFDSPVSFSSDATDKLRDYLKGLLYDGGTDIQNLPIPKDSTYSKILLFTDGFSSLSKGLPDTVSMIPFYTFVYSSSTNIKALKNYSERTGGQLFNLKNTSTKTVISRMFDSKVFKFVSSSFDTKEIFDVFPNSPAALDKDQPIRVFGRLANTSGKVPVISLNFGFGHDNITQKLDIPLDAKMYRFNTPIIPRLWAQQMVDYHTVEDQEDKKEKILNLGRKYGIVTPGSSLLVLTTFEQYKQHKIEPSAELLPEVHKSWKQTVTEEKKNEEQKKQTKLDKLWSWWSSRTEWYNRTFSVPTARRKTASSLIEEECVKKEKVMEKKMKKKSAKSSSSFKEKSKKKSIAVSDEEMDMEEEMIMGCCDAEPEMEFAKSKKMISPSSSSSSSASSSTPTGSTATISMDVKGWTPDKPYIKAIQAQSSIDAKYNQYIKEREENLSTPSFYLDVAHYFFDIEKNPYYGLRIITTIGELKIDDHRLMRILANKLYQEGKFLGASFLFDKIVTLRSEEPQTFREAALGQRAIGNYQKCIDMLWKVCYTEWETRFQHIEDEVLLELNRTIWMAKKKGIKLDVSDIQPKFMGEFPMDIHCSITWDTDDLCIDLHIDQPDGTQCYYGNHITSIGGWSTPDYSGCTAYSTSMIREYMIKKAMDGKYKLGCNYYSNYRQDLTGGAIIWFTVYTNYFTDKEQCMQTTLRLDTNSVAVSKESSYTIGTVDFKQS
eukprot:TRINITY_DN1040_c0_g5_i1.p1 TRINITY_DN1040_c0_g5~~TRINITY_DN1040_c0_g5_i1.p1  ORF type:complete len:1086 (+),score=246.93 TRINITY_DN1040_c0_g5_i1:143-3259(+)